MLRIGPLARLSHTNNEFQISIITAQINRYQCEYKLACDPASVTMRVAIIASNVKWISL